MATDPTGGPRGPERRTLFSLPNVLGLAGYFAVLAVTLWLLLTARQWALAELSRPEATAQWQEWRDAESQRDRTADLPVRRRTPRSAEPPALAILRDSFPGVAVGVMAIVTVLYGFLLVVVRGVVRAS